jgi:ketosteroid isomerase-like protein/catechol 2,3-dioxygenase-like lactoylglutathione lyase family enzyme
MNEQAETDVRRLSQEWVAAELAGDSAALERLTATDFAVVGPVGFVLDRGQWTNRYRAGTFETTELSYADVAVRIHGDAAISIGVHTQKATYQGDPADGSFRSTHIAVREGDRWLLAGMQLSPIGGPPPFAARPDATQGRPGGGPEMTDVPALDHTIVWTTDRSRGAEFLAHVLGAPVGAPAEPFLPIRLGNGITLDYAVGPPDPTPQHYAFRVTEDAFDAALARIRAAGIPYWADPLHHQPDEINHWNDGRGVYFADPDGHNMELLTVP